MKRKFLIIGLVIALAAGLVIGVGVPGLAAPLKNHDQAGPNLPSLDMMSGEVVSIGTDTFSIKSGDQTIAITVDSNTKYYEVNFPGFNLLQNIREKIKEGLQARILQRGLGKKNGQNNQPTPPGLNQKPPAPQKQAKAAFSDIAVGDTVFVRLMPNENLATQVLIVNEPTIAKVNGTVAAVTGNTITITNADNTQVVLNWDANTRFVLKGLTSVQPDQAAVAVYNKTTMRAIVVSITPAPTTPTTSPTTTT